MQDSGNNLAGEISEKDWFHCQGNPKIICQKAKKEKTINPKKHQEIMHSTSLQHRDSPSNYLQRF
jgi:putative AlgH/UPF0301 family transcriptional regulator